MCGLMGSRHHLLSEEMWCAHIVYTPDLLLAPIHTTEMWQRAESIWERAHFKTWRLRTKHVWAHGHYVTTCLVREEMWCALIHHTVDLLLGHISTTAMAEGREILGKGSIQHLKVENEACVGPWDYGTTCFVRR